MSVRIRSRFSFAGYDAGSKAHVDTSSGFVERNAILQGTAGVWAVPEGVQLVNSLLAPGRGEAEGWDPPP